MPNDTVTASHPHQKKKNGVDASLAAVHSHAGMGGKVGGGGLLGVGAWWYSFCFEGLTQYPQMHAQALRLQEDVYRETHATC